MRPSSDTSSGRRNFSDTPPNAIPNATGMLNTSPISAPATWPFVRLYTLGVFQLLVYADAEQWVDLTDPGMWGHGRAQDLATLLLLRGRPMARLEAAEALWPAAESRHRGQLLRNALWNLRRALASHAMILQADGRTTISLALLETTYTLALQVRITRTSDSPPLAHATSIPPHSQVLCLAPPHVSAGDDGGPIWCDVWAFEEAAARAHEAESLEERLALGQAAIRLYGGPFLTHRRIERQRSSGGRQEAHVADWTQVYRTQAHAQWMRLVTEYATDLRRIGEREQALDLLLQALAQDPLHTEVTRRAMLLLVELDRLHEALEIYERCRRAYRDAYGGGKGAEPAALKHLAAEIRTGRVVRSRTGAASHPISGVYPPLERPVRPPAHDASSDGAAKDPSALRYARETRESDDLRLDDPMTIPIARRPRR